MAKKPHGLPSREQILDFIGASDRQAGKREIARAFGLSGADKQALKILLKDMADEGLIDSSPGRAFHRAGGVAKVTVLRVTDVDDSGQAWAVPERWDSEAPEPRLRVVERKGKGASALGIGDRILARTEQKGVSPETGFLAHPMKKLLKGSELVLGVVHREGERHWLRPVEKKERRELPIADLGPAEAGDLVLAEKTGRPPHLAARVSQVLGDPFAPRSFSLIAIHKHDIPHEFPPAVLEEADRVAGLPLKPPRNGEGDQPGAGGGGLVPGSAPPLPATGRSPSKPPVRPPDEPKSGFDPSRGGLREDLTHLPIVAIDPPDARDHDDAIWAAADEDPANEGGWKAIVAIADVGFYVRPGSALDREARRRGNSVYFPDRVVPMLPESLSAEICSLKAGQDRAALACHLRVTKDGQLKSWRFTRAKVRIAANIAYEDAQAAIDASRGQERIEVASPACSMPEIEPLPGPVPAELVETALKPLWACWRALYRARENRQPLELDLPERRVVLDEKGRILSVAPRERLDAHKLVEDYMIAANVAAAKALEAKKAPVMYRVHEPPGREKLVALRDYLKTFGIELALGQVIRPATFNRLIERARSIRRPGESRGPEDQSERARSISRPGESRGPEAQSERARSISRPGGTQSTEGQRRAPEKQEERARSISRPGESRGPEAQGERARSIGRERQEQKELGPGLRRDTDSDEDSAILPQVLEQILRTQSQAVYAPLNGGHFGLALGSYAHFTSPIRRYADLLVHRSLVRACGLGEGGLTDQEAQAMDVTGELISQLERRAMEAERDTIDRYVAAYLSERVGDLVDCRITGVQPFGFFATVEGLGGDGLVPVSTLGADYFRYDEASLSLVGDDSGTAYRLGQRLKLRLAEANPVSGGLRFAVPDAPPSRRIGRGREDRAGLKRGRGRRGRPSNIR
jgi:exoribonuclease R